MHRGLSAAAISLFLFAAAFSSAHAQSFGAEPLTLSVSPLYPAPYETVSVRPQSTLIDLAGSVVVITVNGKEIYRGTGGEGTSFVAGGAGEASTIVVSATVGGQTYKKTVVVKPASVALIMEPVSTTHPFYEGAALVAPEGRVRIIAIADLGPGSGSPDSFVYNWKVGDQVLQSQSGIGRSTLAVSAPLKYRDATVTVTVSSPANGAAGDASASVEPVDPFLLLYRNGPLLGPDFDTALNDSFSMSTDEETFRAVPYFFAKAPSLAWSVNGSLSGSDRIVTVRTTGQGEGTAVLSAQATEVGTYESAADSLSIHFGANSASSGFFGL
jgi:hypothetical protein